MNKHAADCPSPISDSLGDALAGRYTLSRELGQVGMATVYLAQDCRHEQPVAHNVLNRDKSAALGAERFEREIKLLARLRHRGLDAIYAAMGTNARAKCPTQLNQPR